MAKLIIENLTLEQAEELAHWYEGSGEQSADVWFDIRELKTPFANVQDKDWLVVDKKNQTVTMKVK
jgi:phage anti-repressor protein